MANFLTDNEDLLYYVEKGFDWDAIASVTERDFTLEGGHANAEEAKAFYRSVLEMVGEFAAEEIGDDRPRRHPPVRRARAIVDGGKRSELVGRRRFDVGAQW